MLAKAYNTTSTNNNINKELVLVKDIDIRFKNEVNRFKPIIMIKYGDIIDFNYVHIPKLDRYYYVDDIEEVISKGFRPFTELPDITKEYRSQKNFKSFEHRLETLETPIDLETDNIILEKVKVKK